MTAITREQPVPDEFDRSFRDIERAHDRAAAIIASVYLEDTLQSCIKKKFVELKNEEEKSIFSENGPLSNFSAKIQIGYALGLFGPNTCRDIIIIKAIRNTFAHAKIPLRFSEPRIRSACDMLAYLSKIKRPTHANYRRRSWPPTTPRRQYTESCQMISVGLLAGYWGFSAEAPLD